MRVIYLASPYSHLSASIREERFEAAQKAAADMLINGEHVISPICHWHPIAKRFGFLGDAAYWAKYDKELQLRCDRLVVLMLNGWRDSVGVKAELELAERIRQPIEYRAI